MTAIVETIIKPNEKQQKCIDTIDGAIMVLAGPGTGKTFTVIKRLEKMLENGIRPERILCLTFSNTAANEMKTRLIKVFGTNASKITISTYHSFCNDIIKKYPEEFELFENVQLINDIQQSKLIKECFEEYNIEYFKTQWNSTKYFIPEMKSVIAKIKVSRTTKEEYFDKLNNGEEWMPLLNELFKQEKQRIAEGKKMKSFYSQELEPQKKRVGKAKEAWAIYELYNQKLREKNLIEFADMINMVADIFARNETLLKKVSSSYDYYLVDEYQDTNYAQNQVVFQLAKVGNKSNIFAVGDDDQLVYGFQGARLDNFEKFIKTFPEAKVICLDENNRSTQNILDLSYKIIEQDDYRLELNENFKDKKISKKLEAKNKDMLSKNEKIKFRCFATKEQEDCFVVSDIENLVKSDKVPKDKDGREDLSKIAILLKTRNEVRYFASKLKARNIPVQTNEMPDIFSLKPSILTYFYLKALENNYINSDKLFALLASKPFDFSKLDYSFLLKEHWKAGRRDFLTIIRENIDYKWDRPDVVLSFLKTYDELTIAKTSDNVEQLLTKIINKTGILEYYLSCEVNKLENLASLAKIVEEAKNFHYENRYTSVQEFIDYLDTAYEEDFIIPIDKLEKNINAVQVLTIHASKGCEYEYLYLPNLTAQAWELHKNNQATKLPLVESGIYANKEDEQKSTLLKQLFVAITRAKHSLNLSFANTTEDDKPLKLTEFLSNVIENEELFDKRTYEIDKDKQSQIIADLLREDEFDERMLFKHEIKARSEGIVFSPSSLNDYINCPRNFLYKAILKIPVWSSDNAEANIGKCVHAVLENATKFYQKSGEILSLKECQDMYVKLLNKECFSDESSRKESEDKGNKILENYHPAFTNQIHRIIATEFDTGLVPVGNYFIKGFIDRIEENNDGTIELYDYKTATVALEKAVRESKNEEGKRRQLRMYKLAYEILNPDKKVVNCGLIYVQKPSVVTLPMTDCDNDIMTEEILKAYKNMENLQFAPAEKSDTTCKYCNYKQFCTLDVL